MRSLPFRTLAAAIVAALLITSLAEAQQRRGGQGQRRQRGERGFGIQRGGTGNLLSLLRVEEVRNEIKLDETQAESVKAIEQEVRGDQPQQQFNFREASDAEREKYLTDRRARADKEAKAAKEMLATVLSKDQFSRLTEISIQQQGVNALSDPDVAKQLAVTAEQKEKIANAQQASSEELRSKMREFFQSGNRGGDQGENRGEAGEGNFEETRKKVTSLRAEADQKVLAVLTLEQQKQFEAMKGEAFEMPRRGFGGRGGFGGDRRRGRAGTGGGDRPTRPQRPESDQ